jgi:hypothetical protein
MWNHPKILICLIDFNGALAQTLKIWAKAQLYFINSVPALQLADNFLFHLACKGWGQN